MKVLHVVPSFYPATYWGGPIWSTKAICDGVAARADMDLRVLTTDAAGPKVSQRITPVPLPYLVHYARRRAGHSVAPGLFAGLPRAIKDADLVHLTGVYSSPVLPVFALARLMDKPLVWSPRGALQATNDWSAAPNRRAKEAFAGLLRRLQPARCIMHVTAQDEATASASTFPEMPQKIIPNCVEMPPQPALPKVNTDGLRLIFLGRLHPKKGVAELLEAMRQLPIAISLDIYGTGETAYVDHLHQRAADLGQRVRFHGHLPDTGKAAAFARADLFVLPSHSENFGISVAEALAHGVPALTTDATPWQGLETHGCGRCMTLGRDDLAGEIHLLTTRDLAAMGGRGRAWMARDFASDAMIDSFVDLYHRVSDAPVEGVFA
ncbi:MAG: glycosyltransferase [Yoonia sp.]|uniref:glycosyltransferase n=1 Tax=Yoonia sp. TaxID=2212373 RepID=UPI003EF91A19